MFTADLQLGEEESVTNLILLGVQRSANYWSPDGKNLWSQVADGGGDVHQLYRLHSNPTRSRSIRI